MSAPRTTATPPHPFGDTSVTVEAAGAIFNPWYDLTIIRTFKSDDPSYTDPPPKITPRCRIELGDEKPALHFEDDKITFLFTERSKASRNLINPLLYFITFRTFIAYNITKWPTPEQIDPSTHPRVDTVPFRLERIIEVETQEQIDGRLTKFIHHEGRVEAIHVPTESLNNYLRIINPALYYALAFYLRGCENQLYFLVEFYKAVEAIQNTFTSQRDFLTALQPHGIQKTLFKDFGKICNDDRLAPLDIGRHAPMPDAPVYSVDIRRMLVRRRSRDVLETATQFCRSTIDAYIQYLSHSTPA